MSLQNRKLLKKYKDALPQCNVLNSLCPKATGENRSKYYPCIILHPYWSQSLTTEEINQGIHNYNCHVHLLKQNDLVQLHPY